MVPRCQIAARKWPNDSSSHNVIFKYKAQNIERSSVCRRGLCGTYRRPIKTNVANILLLNFCEQKFVQHTLITIAIDCNGHLLLIFEENWPNYASCAKIRTKQWLILGALAFQCIHAGFLCPKCDNFACFTYLSRSNWASRWFFFAKKRKLIGWSIGFNSSQRCLQNVQLLRTRVIDDDGVSCTLFVTAAMFSGVRTVFGFSRFSLSTRMLVSFTELTVMLFFQNPYAIFAHILQHYHDFQSNVAIFPSNHIRSAKW